MSPLRILVVQRLRCLWIARLIEHDIAIEGRTANAATDALIRVVIAHVDYDRRHDRTPLSAFAAAPPRYAELFTWSSDIRTQRHRLDDDEEVAFLVAVAHGRLGGPRMPPPFSAEPSATVVPSSGQPVTRARSL